MKHTILLLGFFLFAGCAGNIRGLIAEKDEQIRLNRVEIASLRDSVMSTAGEIDELEEICLLFSEELELEMIAALRTMWFDFDSDSLRYDAYENAEINAEILRRWDWDVYVEANTCSCGTGGYNYELSLRRAQTVVDFLVNQGVARDRLIIDANGEDSPLAYSYPDFHKINRCVRLVPDRSSIYR
jgi:outer membrane protein OmpA-like peptidoglycan-associated protein